MTAGEQPPIGTACVVSGCRDPATVFVRMSREWGDEDDDTPMCQAHADNWNEGAP